MGSFFLAPRMNPVIPDQVACGHVNYCIEFFNLQSTDLRLENIRFEIYSLAAYTVVLVKSEETSAHLWQMAIVSSGDRRF